ncbi:MAG: TetR/AcrR family transcriptional regulator [Candidatus Dormibacteraeota bacterium]|nr:TetR/AcrR family transcriptional regulator [Candidatus Dormibacteraeota bacterium]
MNEQGDSRKRKYEQRRRAEKQAETRRRIVEATVMFHSTVGPARTTVANICREAGVQRATFYRHFPDEISLFKECRALGLGKNPLPDPSACATIADPVRRLRAGLAAAYAYYRQNEQAMAVMIRDSETMPGGGGFFRFQDQLRDVLAVAWKARGKRHTRIAAACGHAADFQAWRSLARKQGLSDREVIEAMVAMVRAAAGQRPARDSDHIDK